MIGGKVNLTKMRDVDLRDLLGREEVKLSKDEIANYINSARLIRNRIGHRYKQLKIETLVNFLEENIEVRNSLFEFVKSFLK